MTIAYWCVLTMILLPYVFNRIAKKNMPLKNNRNPREYLANLKEKSKRADWAHQNTLEAIPGFVSATIIAHLCQANQTAIDSICVTYIGLRIIYGIFYIYDRHMFRSITWMLSMVCIILLFVVSAL